MTTPSASARLDLHVIPRAGANGVAGERNGRVLVRVTAPPADNRANAAATAVLAEALGLPRRAIRIVMGATSRNKTVAIAGMDAAAIRARLARLP